jgi:hypothetical protein
MPEGVGAKTLDMDNIKVVLDGPEFFTCEYFKTRMLKKRCVERQEGNYQLYSEQLITAETGLSIEYCETCEQGKRIRDELALIQPKPQRGKGDRKQNCLYYSDCLDRAAKKDWKTFKCEGCPLYKPESGDLTEIQRKIRNTRVCETEGCENTTLGPNCPFCPSCMARKANQKRAAKTRQPNAIKRQKKVGHNKAKAKKSPPPGDTAVITIDFGTYAPILRQVEDLAEKEMRPIDLQAIFMLKKYLEGLQDTHLNLRP